MRSWLMDSLQLSQVQAQLVESGLLLLLLAAAWFAVVRGITRRVDDPTVWYPARKATSYVVVTVGFLGLSWIWVAALGDLATFFGLAAAGIAVALSDVLRNIAGWVYIVVRRPYRVDDRIEIGAVAGDVIDIRVQRTTLLEIRNWVDADQSTGRIVHVPNGYVFTQQVFNFTEGFGYIWHEIPLLITFESDPDVAEAILQRALEEVGGHTPEQAEERIRAASRAYKIRYTHLTPTVYLTVKPGGILLTGRLLVDARRRRAIDQQVWRRVLAELRDEPRVELTYPVSRVHLHHEPGEPTTPPQEPGPPAPL
ncbi:MAG: mechanosensitive ion channel family protein [Nitriliruptoraceae bacterium]